MQVPSFDLVMLVRPVALMLTARDWLALGVLRQMVIRLWLAPTPVAWNTMALAPPASRSR